MSFWCGAIQPAHQYFHIDPQVKNILKGEKGSLFTIEPDVFALGSEYKPGDKIEIEIVEVTQPLEFAALPVSLEFNDRGNETLFESAGMFYVGASYREKPLALKADKKIQVKFRTDVRAKTAIAQEQKHTVVVVSAPPKHRPNRRSPLLHLPRCPLRRRKPCASFTASMTSIALRGGTSTTRSRT